MRKLSGSLTGSSSYDWGKILDGGKWELKRGTDFGDIPTSSVQSAAYGAARRHKVRVTTSVPDDDTVVVQVRKDAGRISPEAEQIVKELAEWDPMREDQCAFCFGFATERLVTALRFHDDACLWKRAQEYVSHLGKPHQGQSEGDAPRFGSDPADTGF